LSWATRAVMPGTTCSACTWSNSGSGASCARQACLASRTPHGYCCSWKPCQVLKEHIRYARCPHRQERVGASRARGFIGRHLRRASCDQRPARQAVQAQVAPGRGGPALQRCGEWLATRLGTEPACTEAAECRTRDSKHALQANTCRHLLQRTSAVTALGCTWQICFSRLPWALR